jgi:hypothetical protein
VLGLGQLNFELQEAQELGKKPLDLGRVDATFEFDSTHEHCEGMLNLVRRKKWRVQGGWLFLSPSRWQRTMKVLREKSISENI